MYQSFINLPSAERFQSRCHGDIDRWLPVQTLLLLMVLAAAAFLVFGMIVIFASVLALLMGNGLGSCTPELVQDGLQTTIVYAASAALAGTAMTFYARVYLRSQFGRPTFCTELQADLSRETVMQICQAYLRHQAINGAVLIDYSGGRLVALMSRSSLRRTYIEITTVSMDKDRTHIVVRGMSEVIGKIALLSAFYNDLGACREAAGRMTEVFSAYASQRMRKSGGSSKRAVPTITHLPACPPSAPGWPVRQDAKAWATNGTGATCVVAGKA